MVGQYFFYFGGGQLITLVLTYTNMVADR